MYSLQYTAYSVQCTVDSLLPPTVSIWVITKASVKLHWTFKGITLGSSSWGNFFWLCLFLLTLPLSQPEGQIENMTVWITQHGQLCSIVSISASCNAAKFWAKLSDLDANTGKIMRLYNFSVCKRINIKKVLLAKPVSEPFIHQQPKRFNQLCREKIKN